MNDTLEIREARADEIALVQELIREMAKYEKRPEDMTGTQESLSTGFLSERSRRSCSWNMRKRSSAMPFIIRSLDPLLPVAAYI